MHETKLQLQLQQCQEVFSVFSLSSPTVTFLCSQVEVEVEVEVRGPALDCLSAEPRVPHRSITCKYLRTKLVCSWEM